MLEIVKGGDKQLDVQKHDFLQVRMGRDERPDFQRPERRVKVKDSGSWHTRSDSVIPARAGGLIDSVSLHQYQSTERRTILRSDLIAARAGARTRNCVFD